MSLSFIEDLIRNTSHIHKGIGGSFEIEFNGHKVYYEKIEQYIADHCWLDFESEKEKQRAIDLDSIITVHWYRNTPVGYLMFAAPDLGSLTRWAPWADVAGWEKS